MPYQFSYFEPIHIKALCFFLLLCITLLIIPFLIKKEKNKKILESFLGYSLIALKIFDSIYRCYFEHELWYQAMPFHLCNMAVIFGGLYLITNINLFFNLIYFWFSGLILAVILPGITTYYTKFYIYVFMSTHSLEIFAVIYSFLHLKAKVTFKGFLSAIVGYLILIVVSLTWNKIFDTNFMYINDYIISPVSFIKPFIIYQILLIFLFLLSIIIMYLPFSNNQD